MGTITDLVKIRAQYSSYTVPYVATSAAVHYEYDAYGKILSTTNNQDNIANYNPICYKGYYYFNELSWYHLQSRFYDPETGRFINADDVSLLGESPSELTDKNRYNYYSLAHLF